MEVSSGRINVLACIDFGSCSALGILLAGMDIVGGIDLFRVLSARFDYAIDPRPNSCLLPPAS